MISPHPLDRLVEQDIFAEALALLEPEELVIASLRLEALSDEQIASLLDIDRATVCRRMEQAHKRIVEAVPELAPVLRGRRHRPLRCRRALQRGWICPTIGSAPLVRRCIRGLRRSSTAENGEPARRVPLAPHARPDR